MVAVENDQLPTHVARVLVVEDEALARRALTMLLAESGFKPAAAGSAEEALRMIRRGPLPDVALVDFNLPGMNGMDLINRLRASYPSIFIVMITAVGNPMADNMHLGAIPFLRKPFNFKQLLSLIEAHTDTAGHIHC